MEKHKIAVEKLEEERKNKKIPKEISQEILKKIFFNLIIAIGIMIYFAILNYSYDKINQDNLVNIIEICSGVLLLICLILFEVSYKKDSGTLAITAIEFLVLTFHSLLIIHIITRYEYQFQFYILTSSYTIAIYYVLKSIVLYTKGRREYLKGLSDISEIVKKEEPIKKEAKKQNPSEEEKKKIQHKPKSAKVGKKKKDTENKQEVKKKSKNSKKDEEKVEAKKPQTKTTKKASTRKTKSKSEPKVKTEKIDDKSEKESKVKDEEVKEEVVKEKAEKKPTKKRTNKKTTKKEETIKK